MRRPVVGLLLCLVLAAARPARAEVVDVVVGEVGPSIVTASDIALARALGFFGLSPSGSPIRKADVDRYGAALLAALEASRLGIGPTATELEQAWAALEAQMGGSDTLRDWLEATAIGTTWAHQALEAHLRWRTWATLYQGLTIGTPGATPEPPSPDSDLVVRNLLGAEQAIPPPFAMPQRSAP